jgi:hypothetical protein
MSEVVKFYPKNAAKDADNVLEQAVGQYSDVLIIGYDKEGNFDARATLGLVDGGDMLWLIETLKFKLLRGDYMKDNET